MSDYHIEGQTFDIRRRLTDYSALVEVQRRIVHERRDAILDADVATMLGLPERHERAHLAAVASETRSMPRSDRG